MRSSGVAFSEPTCEADPGFDGAWDRGMTVGRKRVLLVEDDILLALDATDELQAAGYAVVGPCHTVESALAVTRAEIFDAAVLDVGLRGHDVWPVAGVLAERGIPFVLVTGFERDLHVPDALKPVALLGKPMNARQLVEVLANVFD